MKLLFLFITMSFSLAAFADGSACGRFLECGTYEGRGHIFKFEDLGTKFGTKNVLWSIQNSPDGPVSTQILYFDDNGEFVVDRQRGIGACDKMVCQLSVKPVMFGDSDELITQVLTLKFQPDKLEMDRVHVMFDGNVSSVTKAFFSKEAEPKTKPLQL